jgi:hypothetical protein
VTEIENFQKLTHLNQFSRQKTHARTCLGHFTATPCTKMSETILSEIILSETI